MKNAFRQLIRRFGVDVIRYPLHSSLARTARLLDSHRIDCVLDVGANDGGFAYDIRKLGYNGRIVSFEPLKVPFEKLSRRAIKDSSWHAINCAIGDTRGEVAIHVSANSALSSSVLPMLDAHVSAAPDSRYVAIESVPIETLDQMLPTLGLGPECRTFLKVDVQGYERAVLDGASRLLSSSTIVGMQLELSLVPLYAGSMTYRDALDRAETLNMALMGMEPVFADALTGQLLQVDAVFFRNSSRAAQ